MLDNIISVLILGETKFHWQMLLIIFLVVLPFGFVNEIIVDHPNFWKKIWPEVHPVKSRLAGTAKQLFNGVKEEAREIEEKVEKIV